MDLKLCYYCNYRESSKEDSMVNTVKYEKELEHLKSEHLALETEIDSVMSRRVVDPFKLQELKKKKLLVKEAISQIEDILFSGNDAA